MEQKEVAYSGTGNMYDGVLSRSQRGWPADEKQAFLFIIESLKDRGLNFNEAVMEGLTHNLLVEALNGDIYVNPEADLTVLKRRK